MRAQFVRGEDSKKTLGIGLLHQDVSNYSQKELEKYIIQVLPILLPDYKNIISKDSSAGYIISPEPAEKMEKFFKYKNLFNMGFNPYFLIRDYINSLDS